MKSESIRVNIKSLDTLMALAGELVLARNQLMQISDGGGEILRHVSQQIDAVTSQMQEAVMLTRMQPVGSVFSKFQRVVRDISHNLGKKVELVVEGGGVEVDKSVVESIGDPLTHILRNSLDHGLEPPEERLRRGKADTGRIVLSARQEAGHVVIEVRDDGRGIDPEKIAAKALEKGLASRDELAAMSKQEILGFIFKPGFSTAEKLTDVSGRGVGMDVVLSTLKALKGAVTVNSETGKGTTICMRLPLTLAIMPGLLVQSGDGIFAIPQSQLVRLVRLGADDARHLVCPISSARLVELEEGLLPLLPLAAALRQTPQEAEVMLIAVVKAEGLPYALQVDKVLDSAEIVVKSLDRHLKRLPVYAGVTVLGDGRLAPILDIAGIARDAGLELSGASAHTSAAAAETEGASYLLLRCHPEEDLALPMDRVRCLLRVDRDELQIAAGRLCLKLEGKPLPGFTATDIPGLRTSATSPSRVCAVVLSHPRHDLAFLAHEIVDNISSSAELDATLHRRPGIRGSFYHEGRLLQVIDPDSFVLHSFPEWSQELATPNSQTPR
jgi:two-component system chemotaxis sensor kinase CheA